MLHIAAFAHFSICHFLIPIALASFSLHRLTHLLFLNIFPNHIKYIENLLQCIPYMPSIIITGTASSEHFENFPVSFYADSTLYHLHQTPSEPSNVCSFHILISLQCKFSCSSVSWLIHKHDRCFCQFIFFF